MAENTMDEACQVYEEAWNSDDRDASFSEQSHLPITESLLKEAVSRA